MRVSFYDNTYCDHVKIILMFPQNKASNGMIVIQI